MAAAMGVAGRRIRSTTCPEMDEWLRIPTNVEHHHVECDDGAVLHVAESGSGPAVLLLHGVGLRWSVWSAQLSELSKSHRVLAWDMRGHGESSAGTDDMTIATVAKDLARILEALDLHDVVIVGHSMGGMVLARFCVDHEQVIAERSRALVFLATSAAMVDHDTLGGTVVSLANSYASLKRDESRAHYRWADNNLSAVLIRCLFGERASSSTIDEVRRMFAELDPAVTVACGLSIAGHDVRGALDAVDRPSAVVVGSRDRLTSVEHARVLQSSIPGATLHVIDDVGHQVMQEAPDELCELIRRL